MKSVRRFSTLLVAIAGLLLCGTAAKADSFSFTIDSATQQAVPGDVLKFFGTVGNSGDPGASLIYLNGDAATWDDGLQHDSLFVDDSPFLSNFPQSLNLGQTSTGELFSLTVMPGTPAGSYAGIFAIIGGSDGDAQDVLGFQDFAVNVTETPIPEPSSLLLLLSGLAGLAGTLRRQLSR